MLNSLSPSLQEAVPIESNKQVDILILGAGWTATFLIPYLQQHTKLTYASTTRAGGGTFGSIPFLFDPHSSDPADYKGLPYAKCILITFPIKDSGASRSLLLNYGRTHPPSNHSDSLSPTINVIQLGSTGIFDGGPTLSASVELLKPKLDVVWIDRHSTYDRTNARAQSEDELLSLNQAVLEPGPFPCFATTVLNLCGLWGGERSIRNYVAKVAPSKDVLRNKSSIHMIHGLDVSRAIVAVAAAFKRAAGERWMVTDQRVYDWWDLASAWGESGLERRDTHVTLGKQAEWVADLMLEQFVQALPRTPEQLGRALDSREFWRTFELSPVRARLEIA
ncbi:hypothetical protein CROQUDRAFT_652032 [Cronartium quercuum f. sp. fusiforme G11]|uniref:Uncharacterized protein n=1 Tax=Cronartium quercuum f. sp. fusiforme G11 TaxID=708437 RepID=A0A9P6NV69_9BASI|nr:hypothetical protein CROQUDRAFT_652032 [Cronartium quercuum f. sp. fusiforme G11]